MNFILTVLLPLSAAASAAAPREQLQTLTAQLQAAPNDDALRGRVIALAKTLKPAPAVPEEARRAFIRGNTAFKGAKDAAAFTRAAARYEEASNLAPWWPDPYFNRAKADDAADNPAVALRTLKFYVAAAGTAAEKRQGQDLIYELEEKSAGKAADAAAAREGASSAKARAEASIEGAWHLMSDEGGVYDEPMFVVTRKDGVFDVRMSDPENIITDHRETETTLRFVQGNSRPITFELRREGPYLAGTMTVAGHSMPRRFARK